MTLLRNPQLSRAMQAGIEAAEEFHGQAPTRVSRLPGRGVFVEIGDADEILYSPSAGHRRGGWFHKFGKGAKVAVPVDDDGTLRRGELAVFFEGEFDPSRGIVG